MDVSVLRTTSFDNVDNFEMLPYTEAILEKSIVAVPGHDQDALEAIKLDPAVLEAQVKVGTSSSEATTKSQSPASSVTSEHQGDVLRVGPRSSPSRRSSFEEMMRGTKAALFSLTPQQFDLLLQYVATLRQQRLGVQKCLECAFCKRNGESASWYSSHALKDGRGRIRCPVLRSFRCPRCGATGDNAHTIKYCQSYDD